VARRPQVGAGDDSACFRVNDRGRDLYEDRTKKAAAAIGTIAVS